MDRKVWYTKAVVERAIIDACEGISGLTLDAINVYGMMDVWYRHLFSSLGRAGGSYLEVGALCGASAVAFGQHHSGSITSIDSFEQWPTIEDIMRSGPVARVSGIPQLVGMTTKDAYLEQLQRCKVSAQLVVAKSEEVTLDYFCPTDVFYYDGDHSFAATRDNLKRYVKGINPQLVLVDDVNNIEVWDGIQAAELNVADSWKIVFGNGMYIARLYQR